MMSLIDYNAHRIDWIDSLRGFAILLVIVGHLIQFNFKSGIANDLFNLIYSFHMPLFFFISGLCTSNTKEITSLFSLGRYGFRKFLQLLLPSIIWTIGVPCFFVADFGSLFSVDTISSFWFLNSLFAIYLFWGVYLYTASKVKKQHHLMLLILIGLCVLFILDVKRISLMYLLMFIFGHFYQSTSRRVFSNPYLLIFLLFFFVLLSGRFKYGLSIAGDPDRIWLEFPLSVAASILFAALFQSLSRGRVYILLTIIGKYTLGIYLCHFIFLPIHGLGRIEEWVGKPMQLVLLLLIALVIAACCIVVQKMVEPFTWLYNCMYGKWSLTFKTKEK